MDVKTQVKGYPSVTANVSLAGERPRVATAATRSAARGLNTPLLVFELWTKSSIQEHDDAVTPVVVA